MANKKRKKSTKKNNRFNYKLIIAIVLCVIAVIVLVFTISRLTDKEVCEKIHDYDVCEISYTVIDNGNKEFLEWIDDSIGMKKSLFI